MHVHDRAGVRPGPVALQVQRQLGGRIGRAADDRAVGDPDQREVGRHRAGPARCRARSPRRPRRPARGRTGCRRRRARGRRGPGPGRRRPAPRRARSTPGRSAPVRLRQPGGRGLHPAARLGHVDGACSRRPRTTCRPPTQTSRTADRDTDHTACAARSSSDSTGTKPGIVQVEPDDVRPPAGRQRRRGPAGRAPRRRPRSPGRAPRPPAARSGRAPACRAKSAASRISSQRSRSLLLAGPSVPSPTGTPARRSARHRRRCRRRAWRCCSGSARPRPRGRRAARRPSGSARPRARPAPGRRRTRRGRPAPAATDAPPCRADTSSPSCSVSARCTVHRRAGRPGRLADRDQRLVRQRVRRVRPEADLDPRVVGVPVPQPERSTRSGRPSCRTAPSPGATTMPGVEQAAAAGRVDGLGQQVVVEVHLHGGGHAEAEQLGGGERHPPVDVVRADPAPRAARSPRAASGPAAGPRPGRAAASSASASGR